MGMEERYIEQLEEIRAEVEEIRAEVEASAAREGKMIDLIKSQSENFANHTIVMTSVSLMALRMALHVSPDKTEALRHFKGLVANLELTQAQNDIIQPLLTGLTA